MAKLKYASVSVSITFPKVMVWVAGVWLFLLAILNACGVPNTNTAMYQKNSTTDHGAIVLISAFLFTYVTTFVKHKIGKLIAGVVFLGLAVVGIIGVLVTSTSSTSTWVIFVAELIAIIGCIIWILEGVGVLKVTSTK
ncbi:hypothetical protein [Spiroplasma eriocheiris]|uniref:Transmembrane protein n=1 Tax=Spiroplasma eriocheiris TaxID=315358 RepID=A0A0H3XKT9_9MOLU|nr:hypothetical protein [Spiroplasma eriocheiris]AHF57620.1 putative transmembrane protein [Spiroplasma eriocheiris CCTCC M 207170]AKM54074.1 hypothetical protein SERIO_v1c04990 [Spiroplasma eriocheiris]